jgi:hypothetical protein
MNIIAACKCCGKMHTPSDVIVIEERPLDQGGYIFHNFGLDVLCANCRAAAFSEDDYEEMFEDRWVKPCKFEKYSE